MSNLILSSYFGDFDERSFTVFLLEKKCETGNKVVLIVCKWPT